MSLTNQKILGITITTNPKTEILEYVEKYLSNNSKFKIQNSKLRTKPLVIVTPNPEQVVLARRDSHFADLLNGADIAIPDGIGLVIAERLLGVKSQKSKVKSEIQKISGVELMEDLVAIAAKQGVPIALIGGRGGVALKALECLQLRFPGLAGWAEEPGEILLSHLSNLSDLRYLSDKIKNTDTRIVFVGLGAPKQEYFMDALRQRMENGEWRMGNKQKDLKHLNSQFLILNSCVLMSVGGSFDEISGRIPSPPVLIDTLGLKWLWRLALEPWRIKRQTALLWFIWMVICEVFACPTDSDAEAKGQAF